MLIFYSYKWKKSCTEIFLVNVAAAAAAQKQKQIKIREKRMQYWLIFQFKNVTIKKAHESLRS